LTDSSISSATTLSGSHVVTRQSIARTRPSGSLFYTLKGERIPECKAAILKSGLFLEKRKDKNGTTIRKKMPLAQ
jgi:hypothetical protein